MKVFEESQLPFKDIIDEIRAWITFLLIVAFLWEGVSIYTHNLFPDLISVFNFLINIDLKTFWYSLYITFRNALGGYLIGLGISLALTYVSSINRMLDRVTNIMNITLQSISVLIWVMIFLLIFGVLSPIPPILVSAVATLPVLLSNLLQSTRYVDRKIRELAKILGASRLQLFKDFIIPGSIPYIASASRVAVGLALRISVVAEAFGSSGGIGFQIIYNYNLGYSEGVIGWGLTIIIIMILMDQLIFRILEWEANRWRII